MLRVEAREVYRPDIQGPLSIFANVRGSSVVRAGTFSARVPEGAYAITNAGDRYTLEIEQRAETQNLHVGEAVAGAVYRALVTPDDHLLDDPDAPSTTLPIRFLSRLYPRDAAFERPFAHVFRTAVEAPEATDEAVAALLAHLHVVHRDGLREMARLPAARAATRAELYRRLARAMDLAQASFAQPLTLDDLAGAACLSKYHFLRLFRQVVGQTPHQYLTHLRIQAARRLLQTTAFPVAEVGLAVGYDDPSVFSRVFRRTAGVSPVAVRTPG